MSATGRNLIVLADGTGNSAAKVSKTNVWRLYQALDLTDGTQVAVFGDGVGTSSITLFRVLGLTLGIGVKRNVLNLYKFLCRNYNENDKIWVFGFSRGAFTVRVLAGLIRHEGLIADGTSDELDRNALAAYRAYRKKSFPTSWRLFWVRGLRILRDGLAGSSYSKVGKRENIPIHFIGVWDTVAAYGLPIDELTQAVNRWVWPMRFASTSLLGNVRHARQALSLDDERGTFLPIPWDEKAEEPGSERLRQVWFPGAHADVGGGYPDDGLSYVALCWMIGEAADKGLRFEPNIVAAYRAVATPTGRIYDSRAGLGAFWRYQPRNVEALMNAGDTPPVAGRVITPLVHHSVITRMAYGNDGYAPISLPRKVEVLPPDGPPLAFDAPTAAAALAEIDQKLKLSHSYREGLALQKRREFLAHVQKLAIAANGPSRNDRFALVLDTVWWRRVVYFVSLFLVLVGAAFPVAAPWLANLEHWLGIKEAAEGFNAAAGGTTAWSLDGIGGFLPGFVQPWIAAAAKRPAEALLIVVMLLASLRLSGFLQRRIYDRARAAWGQSVNRLKLSGQRHALTRGAVAAGVLAAGAGVLGGRSHLWLSGFFAVVSLVCLGFRLRRTQFPPEDIDPKKPGVLLGVARAVRLSPPAVGCYRFVARTAAPALFLALCTIGAVAIAHRAVFDVTAAVGEDCRPTATSGEQGEKLGVEKLGVGTDIDLKSICHATRLWLVEGRKYRIRLTIGEDWLDKDERADVAGLPTAGLRHFLASPLKRRWWENWFQPIARIGDVGNYEHVLRSVEPSTRELVSDITANVSGELFIYVNDAVLAWPGTRDFFYRNNSGTAKVAAIRIDAAPESAEQASRGDR
jgi:uncharacterized protein (DUF2235 family)